jgi:hypothetical protein
MSLIRTKTQKSVGVPRLKKVVIPFLRRAADLISNAAEHHPPLSTYWNVHISAGSYLPPENERTSEREFSIIMRVQLRRLFDFSSVPAAAASAKITHNYTDGI